MSATLYDDEVLTDDPAEGYWRFEGNTSDEIGGPDAGLVGATLGVPGPMADTTAASFDGVDDYGTIAVDLSPFSELTVEFWLRWDEFASDDALAMEYSTNYATGQGFLVDPNSPAGGGNFEIAHRGQGGSNIVADYFARPTAGDWHYYALRFKQGAQNTAFVDGVGQSMTSILEAGDGVFANAILYLMSRAGSALFGAGDLARLAIYPRRLSPERIAAHFAAASAEEPEPPPVPALPTEASVVAQRSSAQVSQFGADATVAVSGSGAKVGAYSAEASVTS